MRNKKASIATIVLVFMTVALAGVSLFIFITNTNKVGGNIVDSRILDGVYVKENAVNFYINEIMAKAIAKSDFGYGKGDFIDNFKKELEKYKLNEDFVVEELEQLGDQINDENVRVLDNKVYLNVKIEIKLNPDKFKIAYVYEKEFVRSFV